MVRLLEPDDFGIYVPPFVVFSLARVLQDLGTTQIIYTQKVVSIHLKREMLGFNLITTLLFGILLIFLAPALVLNWTGNPESEKCMFWLGIAYLFTLPYLIHETWLKHSFAFRKLFLINLAVTLLSTAFGIYFALRGFHSQSLVLKHLVYCLSGAVLLLLYGEHLRPSFRFTELFGFKKFSIPLIATQFMNFFSRNVDNLLISRYMGESALGLYERSYRMLTFPIEQISGSISRVILPALTHKNDDPRGQIRLISVTLRMVFMIASPVSFVLMIFPEDFVSILFGVPWLDMVPLLRVFGFLILFQSISPVLYNLFIVTNSTRLLFKLQIISQPLYFIGFIFFSVYKPDLHFFILSYATLSVIFSFIFWHYSLKTIGASLFLIFRTLGRQIITATILFCVLILITYIPHQAGRLFPAMIMLIIFLSIQILVDRDIKKVVLDVLRKKS